MLRRFVAQSHRARRPEIPDGFGISLRRDGTRRRRGFTSKRVDDDKKPHASGIAVQDVVVYVLAATVSGAFLLNEVKDLEPTPKKKH